MESTSPCGYSYLELSKALPLMGQGADHFAVLPATLLFTSPTFLILLLGCTHLTLPPPSQM